MPPAHKVGRGPLLTAYRGGGSLRVSSYNLRVRSSSQYRGRCATSCFPRKVIGRRANVPPSGDTASLQLLVQRGRARELVDRGRQAGGRMPRPAGRGSVRLPPLGQLKREAGDGGVKVPVSASTKSTDTGVSTGDASRRGLRSAIG
jgi:hypothetical protein